MRKLLHVFIGFLLLFTACEKAFLEDELSSDDPFTSFDYLWEQIDLKYSYFDVKEIDWNEQKSKYRAQLYGGMSQVELFNIMGNMMKELKDDHANLSSSFNVSYFGVKYEGADNFDLRIIEDNYIGRNYYITGPFIHDFIKQDSIGYVRLSTFSNSITDAELNFVLSRYRNTMGLIIDLRENGGGLISNVFRIMSRFVSSNTTLYKSRIRNGEQHYEFSNLESADVEPYEGIQYLNKPIMVLVDRGSYSASSFFALSTKAIPNMYLVGDTTGGGLGLPNGGQLPNGWEYRFSVTQAYTVQQANQIEAGKIDEVNRENYENGVPPEIIATLNRMDLTKDEIIERAVQEISQP